MRRAWFHKAWRSLSRLRLGVTLLALLLAAVIAGSLFPQVPQRADTEAWWTAIRDRYGLLYVPLRAIGLFDLSGALWFQALLALLLLSTVACFLNRVWPLAKVVFRPRTRLPAERFERATLRAQLIFPSAQTAESALQTALRRRRYRVQVERRARSREPAHHELFLRADRHRLPRLGTLLTHIGLVSLLLGAAWGGLHSWRVSGLAVNSSTVTPVGNGTGVRLKCDRFTILRYDDDTPRDYRAEVTLIAEKGQELTRGTVQVNHPLTYAGVSYHLQGYHMPTSPGGSEELPQACDVTLTAVHDPSFEIVIAAGLCVLAGVTLTFHFPHRRLWARLRLGGEITLVGSTAWDSQRFAHQFEALVAELREEGASTAEAKRGGNED